MPCGLDGAGGWHGLSLGLFGLLGVLNGLTGSYGGDWGIMVLKPVGPLRLREGMGEPRLLHTPAVINIMGVNANGIRTKRKRLMLHRLLRALRVGVGVVTETHLRKGDIKGLSFPDYYVRGDFCRPTPVGERIGGGC